MLFVITFRESFRQIITNCRQMSELNHFYLTLVRHGETDSNRVKTIQGQLDTKLSDIGVKQSQQLSQHLDCNRFDLIFSSDLRRALNTAKIVVGSDERIQTDVRLRERCFGESEGKSVEDLKRLAVKEGIPLTKLSQFTPKGAESPQDVTKRVVDFFAKHLIKLISNDFNVLIVSHGGVIREIIRFMREGLKCQFDSNCRPLIITPNTGVTQFKVFYIKEELISAECLQLHDIQHLSGECKSMALREEQINDDNVGHSEAL